MITLGQKPLKKKLAVEEKISTENIHDLNRRDDGFASKLEFQM